MICYTHLFFLTVLTSTSLISTTTLKKFSDKLSIQVQAIQNPTLLIRGLDNRDFVRLNSSSTNEAHGDIRILCVKQEELSSGRINAFVNTQQARFVKCLEYVPGYVDNDLYCLRSEFSFRLPLIGYSYFEVMCRFVELTQQFSQVNLFLHKLCKIIIF